MYVFFFALKESLNILVNFVEKMYSYLVCNKGMYICEKRMNVPLKTKKQIVIEFYGQFSL